MILILFFLFFFFGIFIVFLCRGSSSPSVNSDAQERIQKLQEGKKTIVFIILWVSLRILLLYIELTACYKRNSEDATAMLTLTNQVQKQQAVIIEKDET